MPARIEHRDIDGAECKRCSTCTEWKKLEQYTKKTTGTADGLCDQYDLKEKEKYLESLA